MTYSTSSITSILEIPALLAAFATGLGFIVDDTDPDAPLITPPEPTDATTFRFRASAVGIVHELTVEAADEPDITASAFTRSPQINGAVSTPLAVSFIGGLSPQPFIATVISYGGDSYRHLYYGRMEALGNYTGGDVISGVNHVAGLAASTRNYRQNSYLFQGRQSNVALASNGGVLVRHAGNPTPFRRFRATTSLSPVTAFTSSDVIGGFGDDVNDGYMVRGRSPFAGVNMLTPINLFAPEPIIGECSFRPLGIPTGVRLVNMQDLPAGARIEIAGEFWRCYPALRRTFDTSIPPGTGNYPSRDTSFMVGYAYFEGA